MLRLRMAGCAVVALGLVLMWGVAVASPASADTYYVWDDWGGTWSDAEKTSTNTDDDLMCWAASSSNVLAWTGWGLVGGMTTTDQMFAHFQAHFSDLGGNPYYAWDWWFDGTNDVQGVAGWAQEDVDGGGGFFPAFDIGDYRRFSGNDAAALSTIDAWLHAGYGTTISIATDAGGAHSITVWGLDTDASGAYTGLWVTDSDDSKGGPAPRPDLLRQYGVSSTSGQWFLQQYGGSNAWYINEVVSLDRRPEAVAEPATIALLGLGLGLGAFAGGRRRRPTPRRKRE